MKSLEEKEWRSFRLTEIFPDIKRGKRLKNADHIPGTMPYVSSSASDNGVDDFVSNIKNVRIFSDCISFANSGSVGSAFYEPFSFVASDHVTHLKNNDFSREVYLFIAVMLSQISSKYSFNREINDRRISKECIMLPVDDSEEPDYDYMAEYIRQNRQSLIQDYQDYIYAKFAELGDPVDIPSLSGKEWKKFQAFGDGGILDIHTTSSSIDGIALKDGNNQTIPYVTRSASNNGIARFVSTDNLTLGYDEGGSIIIGLDTQTAFYQPYKFVTGQNIQIVTGDSLNKYTALFYATILKIQMTAKFNWGGNGATLDRLNKLKIMLPTDDDGKPDYGYMEQYAKNMMITKYRQYEKYLEAQYE